MIKTVIIIFITTLSLSGFAKPLFTAILEKDESEAFIALKDESGKNPSPQIVVMNKNNFKKEILDLPKDIKGREISAMFYHHDKLYVLSQWTIGTGDKPKLASYDIKNKVWTHHGQFSCVSYSKVNFKNKKVELSCESGKLSVIEIAGLQIGVEREIVLPQSRLKSDTGDSIALEGLPYYWRKLKAASGKTKKIHVMSSSEFY